MNVKWQIQHSLGYMSLEMYEDAAMELKSIDPLHQDDFEVQVAKLNLYHHTENWLELKSISKTLLDKDSGKVDFWISYAYATRRVDSIPKAQEILLEAVEVHPKEACIHFNLACYAAQLGKLTEAEKRVKKAIELDSNYKEMALADSDLEPLRSAGMAFE